MRYFFSADDVEPDSENTPTIAAFRSLGLDPDREPEALKVLSFEGTRSCVFVFLVNLS